MIVRGIRFGLGDCVVRLGRFGLAARLGFENGIAVFIGNMNRRLVLRAGNDGFTSVSPTCDLIERFGLFNSLDSKSFASELSSGELSSFIRNR